MARPKIPQTGAEAPAHGAGPAPQLMLLDADTAVLDRIARCVSFRLLATGQRPLPFGCLIVVAPDLLRCDARGRLAHLKRDAPLVPVILVTEETFTNLKRIVGLPIDAVVGIGEIEGDLPGTVRALSDEDRLEVAARSIENALADDILVRIVSLILRSVPPLSTEAGVEVRAGLPRGHGSRLSKELQQRTGWTIPDLLHFVALFRVARLFARAHTRGIADAIAQLHLAERTVQRASRKMFSLTPSELVRRPDLLDASLEEFLVRLTGSPRERSGEIDGQFREIDGPGRLLRPRPGARMSARRPKEQHDAEPPPYG